MISNNHLSRLSTRLTRRSFALLALSIAVAPLLAGCPQKPSETVTTNSPATPTTAQTVRLGSFFSAVDYAPYLVAKDKKWFDEALKPLGSTATYTEFQALPALNEAIAADKLDVVFEAEPPAIVGRAAGIPIKITGISCKLTQEILVPPGGAKDIAGLKGRKIAVLAGTSSHYGVIKILQKAGVSKDDVQIIDMAPPEAKAAFETGKVDAWAVWPPFVEQEELSGKGKTLGGGTANINSIMAMRGGFLDEQPKLAQAVYDTLQKSKDWIQQNPKEAQEIMAKQLNVPLPVVEKAWPRHDWSASLDEAVTKDVSAKADFLLSAKFIKNPVKVQGDLIDTSLQTNAKK